MPDNPDLDAPQPIDWSDKIPQLLAANLRNLAKKVLQGVPLSAAEVALLKSESSNGTAADALSSIEFAKNKSQLADILGINRKTIQRYSKNPNAPSPRPNGSLSVSEWREFLAANDVLESEDLDHAALKARQVLLQNTRLENKIAIEKKEWIPRIIAKQVFTQLVTEAKSRSLASVIRLVTLARVAPNTTDAAEAVRKEVEAVWKSLEDSGWHTPTKK